MRNNRLVQKCPRLIICGKSILEISFASISKSGLFAQFGIICKFCLSKHGKHMENT